MPRNPHFQEMDSNQSLFAITPSDTANLAMATRQIRANGAGAVKLMMHDGSIVTTNFTAGETRSLSAVRVYATSTTATGIEGMA